MVAFGSRFIVLPSLGIIRKRYSIRVRMIEDDLMHHQNLESQTYRLLKSQEKNSKKQHSLSTIELHTFDLVCLCRKANIDLVKMVSGKMYCRSRPESSEMEFLTATSAVAIAFSGPQERQQVQKGRRAQKGQGSGRSALSDPPPHLSGGWGHSPQGT